MGNIASWVSFLLVFAGVTAAILLWVRRELDSARLETGERDPTLSDLRREPGQELRRVILEREERLMTGVLWAMLPTIPLAVGLMLVLQGHPVIAAVFFLLAIPLVLGVKRRFRAWIVELRNLRLGLLGERLVAERLRPLLSEGWDVFHDLQARGAAGAFNLDHVAVGQGVIAVIETKMRRKHPLRDGKGFHEVVVDGDALEFPAFRDTSSVRQASAAASWLRGELLRETGVAFSIHAVVVVPGWYVKWERTQAGSARVVNDKSLTSILKRLPVDDAPQRDLDLARRHLHRLALDPG